MKVCKKENVLKTGLKKERMRKKKSVLGTWSYIEVYFAGGHEPLRTVKMTESTQQYSSGFTKILFACFLSQDSHFSASLWKSYKVMNIQFALAFTLSGMIFFSYMMNVHNK